MNQNTVFIYESATGTITFSYAEMQYWVTSFDGLSSVDVNIAEASSMGQAGTTIAAQVVKPRVLTLNGCLFEPLALARANLIKVIAPGLPATFTMVDGTESWYIDVVPRKTPEIDEGNGVQNFQLSLYAAYPYWRTTSWYATSLTGLIKRFAFPFYTGGTWFLSEQSVDYYRTIENSGNVPISPEIQFVARQSLSHPQILHLGTGKLILLEKAMEIGERFIVTTQYGTQGVVFVNQNGVASNGYKYLSDNSDLTLELLPGGNTLRFDAAENRQNLNVWVNAPMGVRSGV